MLIAEIFSSIQGEGELMGVPSVFVRTSGCNLRCNWCDTPYASWNPEGEDLPLPDILSRVCALKTQHVVLTGGEPMVAKDMHVLATKLRVLGYHITIETAATVLPEGIPCDLASLSPKLANSLPDERLPRSWRDRHETLRFQPGVIRAWIDQYHYQLKFVVATLADMVEVENLVAKLDRAISPSQILLMPEGVKRDVLHERSQWLVEVCKQRGYRYCPRLHIELYGNTRGT